MDFDDDELLNTDGADGAAVSAGGDSSADESNDTPGGEEYLVIAGGLTGAAISNTVPELCGAALTGQHGNITQC